MKILFINPVSKDSEYTYVTQDFRTNPLSLGVLSALMPDHWEKELIDEYFEEFKTTNADIVAVSAFTSSIFRAYQIGTFCKANNIYCVIGGIHASVLPDEAMQYFDTIIIGEAENVWPQFIDDFEKRMPKSVYKGFQIEMKNYIIPDYNLFKYPYSIFSVQTSRGCPLNCSFCTVSSIYGKIIRRRLIENIIDELKLLKNKYIYFVDDNLVGYSKEDFTWAKNLFRAIIREKLNLTWMCFAAINFSDDDELLKLAAKSGCKMVFIGIETEEEESLHSINKSLNLRKLNDYKKIFKNIHRHKILVRAGIIYGTDADSLESLKKRTRFLINFNIDLMQITPLTPLPGTEYFKRLQFENRLLFTHFPEDWDKYNVQKVVYNPKQLSPQELENSIFEGYKSFHSTKNIFFKTLRTFLSTRSTKQTKSAFYSNKNFRKLFLK